MCVGSRLSSASGAALPLVLVFAAFALIVASLYISAQLTIGKPALAGPAAFQALCNARAGIWKGMELLSKPHSDTLAHINALDSSFNKQLFGKRVSISGDSGSALVPDDSPTVVTPYSVDSFGTASVSLALEPCFRVLISKGEFRSVFKSVRVLLGGILYSSADTVCYLAAGPKPEGGVIAGITSLMQQPPPPAAGVRTGIAAADSAAASAHGKRVPASTDLRLSDIVNLVSYYRGLLSEKADSTLPTAPVTVQSSDQCAGIPEVVNGSLFLSGSMDPIVWKEKRRVFVLGDIQISGNTTVENVEFVSSGEVNCYDQSSLHNVSAFTAKRLVVSDRASFSGNALALSSVLICKNARVENKSVIVCYGEPPKDTAQRKKNLLPVRLLQNASVDGIIVACGTPGGIATDRNTAITGALWASGTIVLQGSLCGILRANQVTDMSSINSFMSQTPFAQFTSPKNILVGSIRPLQTIASYAWPFFMGRAAVMIRWDEG